jgi:hypothetical protein
MRTCRKRYAEKNLRTDAGYRGVEFPEFALVACVWLFPADAKAASIRSVEIIAWFVILRGLSEFSDTRTLRVRKKFPPGEGARNVRQNMLNAV